MNRRIAIVGSLCFGLMLSALIFAVLMYDDGSGKVTVAFVNAEASNGVFPDYIRSERFAFHVQNAGSKSASVVVAGIEDGQGYLIPSLSMGASSNPVRALDHVKVEPRGSAELYLYLPQGVQPKSVRMRIFENANAVRKTQVALRHLVDKASGRYKGKQVWFDRLQVPVCEFTVSLWNEAEPDGATNGSQPIRSATNSTSSAAGSRR